MGAIVSYCHPIITPEVRYTAVVRINAHVYLIHCNLLRSWPPTVSVVTGLVVTSMHYLLTPWSRVLLEKLTGFQLVKKFPRILWNPKVHYRIHKCPPPVLVLSQLDPVHAPTLHFLKILLNIILPSMPGSPKWSLPPQVSPPKPCIRRSLYHTRYMPRPTHCSRFYRARIYCTTLWLSLRVVFCFLRCPCWDASHLTLEDHTASTE